MKHHSFHFFSFLEALLLNVDCRPTDKLNFVSILYHCGLLTKHEVQQLTDAQQIPTAANIYWYETSKAF